MRQTFFNCMYSIGATFTGWHLLTAHDDSIASGFIVSVVSGILWTMTILDFFDGKYSK